MTSKMVAALVVVLLSSAIPQQGWAQHAGFRIGIAPPRAIFVTPQAPAVAPAFIASPQAIVAGQVVASVPFPGVFPTVVVPNHILLPGQTLVPPAVVSPSGGVFFPGVPVQPALLPAPPLHRSGPMIGTPRVEVIRQFGPPSVTVFTSAGETMHFPGGVTVVIQNGRVVGPR
jgi:hypothetical protein